MRQFRSVVLRSDRAVATLEAGLIALLVVALTGVAFAQVVSRYVFNDPLIWSEEAARYLFVWVSLIGAALGVREGAHYGLEALVLRVPPLGQVAAGCGAALVTALFLSVLLVTGWQETELATMQYSATLPMRMHWAYLALPVGAALSLLHLGAQVVRFGYMPSARDLREAAG